MLDSYHDHICRRLRRQIAARGKSKNASLYNISQSVKYSLQSVQIIHQDIMHISYLRGDCKEEMLSLSRSESRKHTPQCFPPPTPTRPIQLRLLRIRIYRRSSPSKHSFRASPRPFSSTRVGGRLHRRLRLHWIYILPCWKTCVRSPRCRREIGHSLCISCNGCRTDTSPTARPNPRLR